MREIDVCRRWGPRRIGRDMDQDELKEHLSRVASDYLKAVVEITNSHAAALVATHADNSVGAVFVRRVEGVLDASARAMIIHELRALADALELQATPAICDHARARPAEQIANTWHCIDCGSVFQDRKQH